MNEEVQHVVTLPADLQTGFDPVEVGCLEKFRGFEGTEEVPLLLRFGVSVF